MSRMPLPFPAERAPGVADRVEHGIYRWEIEGVGVYIGRFTGEERPTEHYSRNINRWLEDLPYRKSQPAKWRAIHKALRLAVEHGLPFRLTIIEACEPEQLNERERVHRTSVGTLNGRRGRRTVSEACARLGIPEI